MIKEFYSVGDIFYNIETREKYILTKVSNDINEVVLINLNSGMNYGNPVIVINPGKITEKEFNNIKYSENFKKVLGV